MLVYQLLHLPFLTPAQAGRILQTNEAAGQVALEACATAQTGGRPLVTAYKDVWMLSSAVLETFENRPPAGLDLRRRGMIFYRRPPDAGHSRAVIQAWLTCHDRITSADYARMTGLSKDGANRALERFVPDLLEHGPGAGRNAHFVAADSVVPVAQPAQPRRVTATVTPSEVEAPPE